MGLAGVSLLFDVSLFTGALKVARQLYHFTWVLTRPVLKSQILCCLFEYVYYLRKKNAMLKGVVVTSVPMTPRSLY
ncbi:hypothetical protein MRX96_016102 [Rhipicephalus microplus]